MGFVCREQVRVDEFGGVDAGPMSATGQNAKYPMRADIFRFASTLGRYSNDRHFAFVPTPEARFQ